jgi:ATP-binding cassette, subfamily B, bacterial
MARAATMPDRPPLRPELRRYRKACLQIAGAAGLSNGTAVLLPFCISYAIDRGVTRGDSSALLAGVIAVAVVGVANMIGARLELGVTAVRAQRYLRDLRVRVVTAILRADMSLFEREKSGSLFARATNDVENLQRFAEQALPMVLRTVFLCGLTLAAMLAASPELTAVVAATLVPVVIATVWYRRVAFQAQVKVRDRVARLFGHMNEHLSGLRVVQAFALEDERLEDFRNLNDRTFGARMNVARLDLRYFVLVEILYPLSFMATLAASAWLIDAGRLTVGEAVAFGLLVGRLFEPIHMVAELVDVVQAAASSLLRILGVIASTGEDLAAGGQLRFTPKAGEVRMEKVRFRYGEGPWVLDGLDLNIAPGETVALVGPSGAGKSTLAKVLVGLQQPASGAVQVDGQVVAEMEPSSLRSAVCLVPQEGYLFSGPIAENIRLARPDATRAEVEAVCAELGILDRFRALPEGLDTLVGSSGSAVSAGERQLVAMARALLADPTVLILDEATSNLDPATERDIAAALRRVLAGRTAIVIAHRPGTVAAADRVISLDGGQALDLELHAPIQRPGELANT